ncbi:MAG: hypothetical protein RIC29_14115 [Rhodospirillaceae bacterium]
MGRLVYILCVSLICTQVAHAENLTLSYDGTFLGRVKATETDSPLQITINLKEDLPVSTHVMARFQNNTPYHRLAGGAWHSWSETRSDLVDAGFVASDDGTLTFKIIDEAVSLSFFPVVFTIAYTLENGRLKSGYMVIDQ